MSCSGPIYIYRKPESQPYQPIRLRNERSFLILLTYITHRYTHIDVCTCDSQTRKHRHTHMLCFVFGYVCVRALMYMCETAYYLNQRTGSNGFDSLRASFSRVYYFPSLQEIQEQVFPYSSNSFFSHLMVMYSFHFISLLLASMMMNSVQTN